ncbi:EpsG family protein [Selenomonas caprae]|nr:EpsG family protein [Selenomonas caprae]
MNEYIYHILVVIISTLVGFRAYDMGEDTTRYYEKFFDGSHYAYAVHGEVGSYLLMEMAYQLNSPRLFFALVAFVVMPIYMKAMKEYPTVKNSLGWGYMLFLGTTVGLSAVCSYERQVIACGVVLYATKYLLSRNILKYTILIMLASTFHISSFFLIVLYPLTAREVKYENVLIVGVILCEVIKVSYEYISLILPHYGLYFTDFSDDGHGIKQMVLYCLMYVIFAMGYIKYRKDFRYNVFFKIYTLGIVLLLCFYPMLGVSVSVRIAFVCLSYMFLLLGYCVEIDNAYIRMISKVSFTVALTALYFYAMDVANMIPFDIDGF